MLGDPKLRSTDPSPQRDLSPLSNCIIRFFVNATCVWIASSNNKVRSTIVNIIITNVSTIGSMSETY